MLHIIEINRVEHQILFKRIAVDDSLLWVGNSVLSLAKAADTVRVFNTYLKTQRWYVLEDDLQRRGLLAEEIIAGVTVINYQAFVNLTLEHSVIQSWN